MDVLQREELGYGLARERSYARALRLMLRHASRTVYATEFMRRNGIRAGAPRSRTVVVRKGVDLGRFHPAADRPSARRALGVDTPVILAVGSLHPRKGHACVLRALALVRDVPWTFVVCGDGGERTGLETQVQETGLQGRVRFLGSVSREMIGRYFSIADVFVHGALIEAAGNVILEALASGCAVVATASGGPEEYLADGMTGFTVAVGDAPAMAARIRELLSNPRLRLSISDAARQSAEQQYSYARMVRELIGVYQRASDAWLLTPEENRPATAGRAA
jgi:glycosyltransferase involved in cell wall biosynthesis